MADLLDMLESQLGGNALDMIANQIGGNKQQTSTAVAAALPMIMQALNKNASSEQGAQSLFNAVAKDHENSNALDNIGDLIQNFQSGPGAGILRHVLGPKQRTAESVVAKSSGLNSQATGQLMQILAPMVMAQLGKQKKQQGLDIGGLVNLLNNNSRSQQKRNPQASSFLNQFLDQDGDGQINDDIANMGIKAIGNFFKKR